MMNHHTIKIMPKTKIAITLKKELLAEIDALVTKGAFPNRSQAIEAAVEEKAGRLRQTRLLRECRKLNPSLEKELAEEGLSRDGVEWPEY